MPTPLPLYPVERCLQFFLRVSGVITGLAILAVFMPLQWMNQTHEELHLGPIPTAPVFEYLARTVSYLYFVHGGLCFVLAGNVRRFGPVITYVALSQFAFALLVFWIDYSARMPLAWTLTEAPAILLLSGAILFFRLAARKHEPGSLTK